MRTLIATLVVAVLLELPSRADGIIQLTISGGRVWLVATEATAGQVLAEWARVGQTRILNADSLSSGPLTLQLVGVPEQHALEVLLRSAAGFVARRRPLDVSKGSQFDRILILGSSQTPAAATVLTAGIELAGSAGAVPDAGSDLDPEGRLNALEAWRRDPGESLDPVTSALVDPDERVRARAQELFEEALARF
jgi:hypothetical protein